MGCSILGRGQSTGGAVGVGDRAQQAFHGAGTGVKDDRTLGF